MRQNIAIVGTGISGLGAAWALHEDHDLTIFEADSRIGGHSNTVDVDIDGTNVAVDTGFIVYNEVTYPNLTRLFDHLGVPTEPSDMSFSCMIDGELEYGASLRGILAHPTNLLRRDFRSMLADIARFRRVAADLQPSPEQTIGELLATEKFSDAFGEQYLYPMTAAIWSARTNDMRGFPARSILRFLANHGLIEIVGRPKWRTVTGGSRSYVELLTSGFAESIQVSSPVTSITRTGSSVIVQTPRGVESFDHVVLATHSDQALAILGSDASPAERELLGAIGYEPNRAILHSDPSLMPESRAVWSSWNTSVRPGANHRDVASLTYWMNRLQNLETQTPVLVTLNPTVDPDPSLTHASFDYAHPQFSLEAIEAQAEMGRIQGVGNTWFAGAYTGYGFHEDGLQSGLNVAAALGSPAPWAGTFEPMSSSPSIPTPVSV